MERAPAALHLHFRYRTFLHFDMDASLGGNRLDQEFGEVGIMSHDHDGLGFPEAAQQSLEVALFGLRAESIVQFNLRFESHFVGHQACGLERTF